MYHEVQNQTHSSMHTQGLLLTHSERQRSSLKKKIISYQMLTFTHLKSYL